MLPFLISAVALASAASATTLAGIPTVSFELSSDGSLDFSTIATIIVDEKNADAVDTDGLTLIPPTLLDFAGTFAEDLVSVLDFKVAVKVGSAASAGANAIFLTLGDKSDYLDVAGRQTSEGYSLEIAAEEGITITGASPLGVWWGTRTIVQQLLLHKGALPLGQAHDAPGWHERGMMLDMARHWFPADFLIEMCSYMSFFKQNTLQAHLSDNLYNNAAIYSYERQMDLYAAFRLFSDDPRVEGLNRRQNESYTREVWDDIQTRCAARGVTILPEIEAPGHALVFSQWKPEIGMTSDYSLLNVSHPDTIPVMKEVWEVFLPWFQSKVVHIGADEYRDNSLTEDELADEYTLFCNELNKLIKEKSGKQVRLWGTFPPSDGGHVDTDVSVQHWAPWEGKPVFDWLANNYTVVNSADAIYIVGKWSQWYGQQLNQTYIFRGAPGGKPFRPYIFDSTNTTNNAAQEEAMIEGHIAPQWFDYGPNGTTVLEAYWAWRNGLPALADKQWGGELTEEEYAGLFEALQPFVPDQNLDRRIPSQGPTILDDDFATGRGCQGKFKDVSGNRYHAASSCGSTDEGVILQEGCEVTTPLSSKGRNYTMSFSIKPTSDAKGPIFTGGDSALWHGNGTVDSVMAWSGDNLYALNYTFPVGEWTNASLISKGDRTFLEALDYRAAVFEKMGRLDLAKKDAAWLLEIAPRSLEGYLRMGKVYRLEKEPELALAFWNAGIEVGAKEGHGGSAKLKQLFDARAPLQKRYGRKDPMELPLEIVDNIFSHLDFRELCWVHGVCKRWDHFFASRTRLWRRISFPSNLPASPSLEFLRKISKRSASGARALIIPRARALQLTQAKWHALLQSALPAEHLELGLVHSFIPELPSDHRILNRLVSLRLSFSALENRRELNLVVAILEHAKDTLESLWIDQAPYLRTIPLLSRLKYLRLSGEHEKHSIPREMHAIGVATSTPNLQQLHLTNYLLRNNQEFDEGEFWSMWSKLEAVVVEHQILGPITDHTNRRIFPPLRSLRAFESRTLAPAMQPVPFPHNLLIDYGNNLPSDDPDAGHDHLQRFWVEGVSITPALQAILEPAIKSGSLRELALCFPDHRSPDWGSVDQPAQAFLEQIPWLYGVESVRTLGLFDFNLDTNLSLPDVVQSPAGAPRRLPERDQAKLLVKFIETFPNLETLALASSLCESRPIAVITEAVARQGKVKKFYVQGLTGALLDHMRAFGEEKGVEILHHREVSPWPVLLEDRNKA
ncbi:Beta-hexosaminidase like protein [Verticillium longisporum]|nr:Beta-hexosaminidase like protein [Verticillium longisporum]